MKKPWLIILICLLVHNVVGQTGGQWLEKKISISVQDMPVEQVLKAIEKDLNGMIFAYSPGSFDVTRRVTVKLDSVSLKEVLEQVFAEQSLECAEMRGKIFLKKKKKDRVQGNQNNAPRRRRSLNRESRAQQQEATKEVTAAQTNPAVKSSAETSKTVNTNTRSQPANQQQATSSPQNHTQKEVVHSEPTTVSSATNSLLIEELSMEASMTGDASARADNTIVPLTTIRPSAVLPTYRLRSFEKPELPPVPFDSSQIREPLLYKLGILKPKQGDKVKVKKPKKPDEPEEKKLRIYGASTTGITGINGEAAIKMGGRAVWLKNSQLGFGLAGYALQTPMTLDNLLGDDYRVAGGYGGFLFEYNMNPNRFLHLSFPLVVGGGGITYVNGLPGPDPDDPKREASEAVFVVEPGVNLEMNVIRFLKVSFGLTYRYTSNAQLDYQAGGQILPSGGLNGLSGGFTVKFGIF